MEVSIYLNYSAQGMRADDLLPVWKESQNSMKGQPCYNDDQNFSINGRIITYTGQRHPFWQDGGAQVLMEILTGVTSDKYYSDRDNYNKHRLLVFKDAPVVEYKTSDPRLKWYEVLHDYLTSRGTDLEVAAEAVKRAKRDGWRGLEMAISYYGEKARPLVRAATLSPRQANAEFDREFLKLALEYRRVLGIA